MVGALGGEGVIFAAFFSAVLLSAIYAVSENKGYFFLALLLAVPAFAGRWAGDFLGVDWFTLAGNIFSVLCLGLTAVLILSHVLKAQKVTPQKICGALSVYLLIGLIWALLFFVIEFLLPGSFRIDQDVKLSVAPMFYYSFVTLTTLGYGDIVPISPPARALASLEALTGQLYITVLVARLVALHVTHSLRDSSPVDNLES